MTEDEDCCRIFVSDQARSWRAKVRGDEKKMGECFDHGFFKSKN